MIAFFISLRPANDEQRQYLASARDIFGTIVETQVTIFRSLVDRVPSLLLVVVLGWSCVLFFGYGLLSDVDALTIVLAALGAMCVASAVLPDPRTERPLLWPVQDAARSSKALRGPEMAVDAET